ncbi:other/FunK1 protein kinase [Coprinopsis cinerea AmutBmut pab1-1]|nr:other/FunK1 protein kinase [Coprinopsis cinerea AmutBmut pab1-1]
MFGARWVHRDISAGNILGHLHTSGVDPEYQAKLGDLEYARRYSSSPDYAATTDPKIGTPFFMACEILFGAPFAPPPRVDPPPFTIAPIKRQRRPRPVIPSILHDLESIWWIAVWTILTRTSHPPSIDLSRRIFVNDTRANGYSPRIKFFQQGGLHAHVLPELTAVAAGLDSVAEHLLFYFLRHTLDSDTVDSLHGSGFEILLLLFEQLSPVIPALALTTRSDKTVVRTSVLQRKRPRSNDDGEYQPGTEASNAPPGSGKALGSKRSKTRNQKADSGS